MVGHHHSLLPNSRGPPIERKLRALSLSLSLSLLHHLISSSPDSMTQHRLAYFAQPILCSAIANLVSRSSHSTSLNTTYHPTCPPFPHILNFYYFIHPLITPDTLNHFVCASRTLSPSCIPCSWSTLFSLLYCPISLLPTTSLTCYFAMTYTSRSSSWSCKSIPLKTSLPLYE